MRKFMFTSEEIAAHRSDPVEWHRFVRCREAEMSFSLFPAVTFRLALELGAGDGGQSITISRYCGHLICTEKNGKSHASLGQAILTRKTRNVEYRLCDAQDLSQFADATFDLVFSSNMMEHIPDVGRCLRESRRVLKDDGVMLHAMPNRWWKLFNSVVALLKRTRPCIHGTSTSHFREFCIFGSTAWRKKIESNALLVSEVVGLPFYFGHGRSFIWLVKAGNASKIPASYLYIVRKR